MGRLNIDGEGLSLSRTVKPYVCTVHTVSVGFFCRQLTSFSLDSPLFCSSLVVPRNRTHNNTFASLHRSMPESFSSFLSLLRCPTFLLSSSSFTRLVLHSPPSTPLRPSSYRLGRRRRWAGESSSPSSLPPSLLPPPPRFDRRRERTLILFERRRSLPRLLRSLLGIGKRGTVLLLLLRTHVLQRGRRRHSSLLWLAEEAAKQGREGGRERHVVATDGDGGRRRFSLSILSLSPTTLLSLSRCLSLVLVGVNFDPTDQLDWACILYHMHGPPMS